MPQKIIYLKDLAEPWRKELEKHDMIEYPYYATLADVSKIEEGKDILLKDSEGNKVSYIPYHRLIETVFQSWREVSAYYDALLSAIGDAVTGVNQNGEIVTWNQASEEFYGYSWKEVMGQSITQFFKEEAIVLKQIIRNGEPIERKYNQPMTDVHVIINATPVYSNGRLIGGISVERDISDVVRLNEELSNTKAYIFNLENKYERNRIYDPFDKIKGKSRIIRETIAIAKKVAKTDATILITGESGVGKELFAEAIHNASHRSRSPFIAINCGAIPASLFESELFGYEKGTFTGASKEGKKGKIDLAEGGTLFLDEVGELPLDLQVKLLRVLQEKRFYRLGGNTPIPVDVRIITATNRNLEEMIEQGKFREDLYYRLNVISLQIPPLRERREDIPELLSLFLEEFSIKYGSPIPKISSKVMSLFLQYEWRGNIRQLRNMAERLIILSGGEEIEPRHLPSLFFQKGLEERKKEVFSPSDSSGNKEEEKIRDALKKTFNNKSAAAKLLGISRATLYNKMQKFGIQSTVESFER
ncbi:sigma-54 interaction domain-containing protein [Tepidibacillus fermentans]|uniref:Transcriptional regulator n=1 Tax=Tepidibacillus fermentans TaxID=1281767 RepID=A0A4R3KD75_9BACI|nr:sigma 54-interacting transcriptional regulator [Tepidibacillus fermentans]TCS80591.1 transcriptional regulator [Tepidibacillus fermentans]